MVSQPDHSRTLALRAPPSSVISRRQRRHGRSHLGVSSSVPLNSFPVFTHTGDVEIIVTVGGRENRYLLHRLILAQCSGFFETSTSPEWSRATQERVEPGDGGLSATGEPSTAATVAGAVMNPKKSGWRYELDFGTSRDDVPMLVQKEASSTASLFNTDCHRSPPPVRNKPTTASHGGFFRSVANLSLSVHAEPSSPRTALSPENEDLLRDYDNLFRIFYNHAPSLDSVNVAAAYSQCKSLLALADMYDALGVIGPRIDHHLLQFQGRLFKQIAKYPPSYLKLAYLARSKIIFREALIHIIGQWPTGERHLRSSLPAHVLDLVEDKVDEMVEMLRRIESQLLRLTLFTVKGERVTPYNSYSDWLVISLFRQWFVEATTPAPPPPAKPSSSGRRRRHGPQSAASTQIATPPPPQARDIIPLVSHAIKTIGTDQASYLDHDDCKRFLKSALAEHYSRESLRRFEKRMEELKGLAAQVVRAGGLMESELVVDGHVGYLTCTRLRDDEFPWDQEA